MGGCDLGTAASGAEERDEVRTSSARLRLFTAEKVTEWGT
jgi:hypothetical protein